MEDVVPTTLSYTKIQNSCFLSLSTQSIGVLILMIIGLIGSSKTKSRASHREKENFKETGRSLVI